MNNKGWQCARRDAGLPLVRVHDLRHSFACRLRAAGVSAEDREALLGHANHSMAGHYASADVGHLLKQANRLLDRSGTRTVLRVGSGRACPGTEGPTAIKSTWFYFANYEPGGRLFLLNYFGLPVRSSTVFHCFSERLPKKSPTLIRTFRTRDFIPTTDIRTAALDPEPPFDLFDHSATSPIERLEQLRAIAIDLRSACKSSRQTLSASIRQPIRSRQERCSASLGNEAAIRPSSPVRERLERGSSEPDGLGAIQKSWHRELMYR